MSDELKTIDTRTGGAVPEPRFQPWEPRRDWFRFIFAEFLLMLLGIVIVRAMWAPPAEWQQTKDMLAIVLPALTGLIGSAFAFYYGSQPGR